MLGQGNKNCLRNQVGYTQKQGSQRYFIAPRDKTWIRDIKHILQRYYMAQRYKTSFIDNMVQSDITRDKTWSSEQ